MRHLLITDSFFLTNGILYFYDMTDNEAVPMCPDMTCSHKDSKCKAFAADKMDYDPYDLMVYQ